MKVTVCEDIELKCQVCHHEDFVERVSHAQTLSGALFGANWPARGFVCSRCGYVHWFLPVEG